MYGCGPYIWGQKLLLQYRDKKIVVIERCSEREHLTMKDNYKYK